MAKLRVYLRIFWLCLKSTRKLNLFDVVIYQGKRHYLTQGVCAPSWNLSRVGDSGPRPDSLCNIHESQFRKERSLSNVMHDLRSTYRFFRGYWFDIWVREYAEEDSKDA